MATASVTLSTLQQTIARAVERFPRERGRIERAATLIALGHVELIGETSAWVASQTGDGRRYLVTPGRCNCIDAQRHPGQSCKHQWAVDLVQVAEERQRRLDVRESEQARRAEVTADSVALAYARSIGFGRAA